jgi:hypothetical protein
MDQVRLGRGNLQVSRVALGTWLDDAIATADLALDQQAVPPSDEIVAAEVPVGGPSPETV